MFVIISNDRQINRFNSQSVKNVFETGEKILTN